MKREPERWWNPMRKIRWCWIFRAVAISLMLWVIGCPYPADAQEYTSIDVLPNMLVVQGQLNTSVPEAEDGYFYLGTWLTLMNQGDLGVQRWLSENAVDLSKTPDTLEGYVRLTIRVIPNTGVWAVGRAVGEKLMILDQLKATPREAEEGYCVIGPVTLFFRPDLYGADPTAWLLIQQNNTVELVLELLSAT